jgi:NAD(P)-dependent dehydrogenase (short-subunit alcohol dehydrogenase family)
MIDYTSRVRLDGRGFVVVGAGNGIGRETAHALRAFGAELFCVDIDEDLAKEVAAEVDGVAWGADARDRRAVQDTVRAAEEALGTISGFVDIVGNSRYAPLLDMTDDDFAWTTDMVLRHAFLFSQLIGRHMSVSGGGSMVFVSSIAGVICAPRQVAYGAAKAGLNSLVKTAAIELSSHRIRVNAVAPGTVRTPRVAEMLSDESRRRFAEAIPLGELAEPSDIAAAIVFLSSDLARQVTGQTLMVDGGASVKFPYPVELMP